MSKKVKKNKKPKMNWRDLIFHLHNFRLSEQYTLFMAAHPNMSKNRCAFYVLKKNYSTTYLRAWREVIRDGLTIPQVLDALKAKVDWYGM